MNRLDHLLDHGLGLARTLESCIQPRAFQRWAPPRDVDLRGKVAVVTGGSSGVAKEVIRDLAARGATVYSGCRRTHLVPSGPNLASSLPATMTTPYGSAATRRGSSPRQEAAYAADFHASQQSLGASLVGGATDLSPAGVVATSPQRAPPPSEHHGASHPLHLDLADLASVEAFAGRVKEAAGRVDMLVLCAAIAGKPYKLSPQGFEIHYATNFLGHFALTQHLLPELISARARVVVVSSILHSYVDDAGPDFRYPAWPPLLGISLGWWAYCRSNLAKTWFGYELQRRHPELTVPVVHPGVIDSGLTVVPTQLLQSVKAALLISPIDGARTPLYAALSPQARGSTFYHNVLGIIGSSASSYDVTRSVPQFDYALGVVRRHSASLAARGGGSGSSGGGSGGCSATAAAAVHTNGVGSEQGRAAGDGEGASLEQQQSQERAEQQQQQDQEASEGIAAPRSAASNADGMPQGAAGAVMREDQASQR